MQTGDRKGRGAQLDPPNRFESTRLDRQLDREIWETEDDKAPLTQVLTDNSKSILSRNSSPDIPFDISINPYRGCEHGCSYCYARPTHETLGFNAGIDFESRIMIKPEAPRLLREALMKASYQCDSIAISGVTDCYQPLERQYRITRACLEVLAEFRNPCSIITKNALILRDLDILGAMAEKNLVRVCLSVTTLDRDLAVKMEPRTSPPALRLEAIRRLRAAGVPVTANVAPVIPGLTDQEIPRILEAVADAGALRASMVLLRLPLAVEPIFLDWLQHHYPLRAQHVQTLIRDTRGGELYQAEFGKRQTGDGQHAEQIQKIFRIFQKKFGLDRKLPELDRTQFHRPGRPTKTFVSAGAPGPGELFPEEPTDFF